MSGQGITRRLFPVLLLASGFAGISYEILYGRILGNLIGDQFAVSAAILITFLFGIGIGSRQAWRLWSWLWLIELLIGLCGAALVFGTDMLDSLLYSHLSLLPPGLSGSILAAVLLLLLPAFLIGCSVPLFAGYLHRLQAEGAFIRVYAIYNLGAALTAILIEFLLLRWFGIRSTVLFFVTLNLLIALLLRFIAITPASDNETAPAPTQYLWWLIPVSMASAVFQLLMIKIAEMLLGPFRESFALVLSIILLGIALGAMLVRRLGPGFGSVLLLALAGMLWLLLGIDPASRLYAMYYERAAESYALLVLLKWSLLFVLMGLPAIAFGATIPALLQRQQQNISQTSGQLLFIVSMANVAGFLLMAFVLHRYFDYGVIVLGIVALTAISLLLYRPGTLAGAMASLLLLACAIGYETQWDESLLYVGYTRFHDTNDLAEAHRTLSRHETFKGYQDVFAINHVDGNPYFFINGYNSIPLNNPSEKIVGAVSSRFSPHTNNALVLGLGSGATASVVGSLFAHTDVVEINPVVRENLFRMKRWNFDIEHNPRVNIVVDDAIHYTKASQAHYDLILNTVTTPLYFSSAKLYTRNFFSIIKQRLNPGGIYVTWMDARIGDRGADIILRTIRDSFRHCALLYIKSAYFLLICSDTSIHANQLLSFQPGHPVYDNLLREHGIIAEWLPYQLLTNQAFKLIGQPQGPLNSDDYPALEFEMARLRDRGLQDFRTRLEQQMSLQQLQAVIDNIDPAALLWHTELRLGDDNFSRRWRELLGADNASFRRRYQQLQRDYYRRLIAEHAGARAFHHFGYIMMEAHYTEDAILLYRHALQLDPRHNNTHFNLAACLERRGRYDEALTHYRMEGEIDPDDADVPYRIGRVYVKMERYTDAIEPLQTAIRLAYPNVNPHIYNYLGQAYEALGQTNKATVMYRKASSS